MALGRILVAVALDAQQHVILCGKWPIDQRSAAFVAEEAIAVPVAVLVRQILHGRSSEECCRVTELACSGLQKSLDSRIIQIFPTCQSTVVADGTRSVTVHVLNSSPMVKIRLLTGREENIKIILCG